MNTRPRALAIVITGLIVAAPVWLAGCSSDPAETVTVEITGVADDTQGDQIKERLKEMIEGSSHSMSSTRFNADMTVTISPVVDVQAYADKIDFGEVTSVEGRVIQVDVSADGDGE